MHAWKPPDLRGRVAVVTGASRGVGRGIAHELGFAGATVYVTGRSIDGTPTAQGPGTIDETARLVTEAGGKGVAVRCDHTVDGDVAILAERVRREQGHLDLLVNNVWGGYENYDPADFEAPFWEQPIGRWDRMMTAGLRAHYVASVRLVPLMLPQRRGLVVMTSAGDRGMLLGDVQYDLAKSSVERLALAMAFQLKHFDITCLAVEPGFTRTEKVVAATKDPAALQGTDSPRFVGRGIASLAADPAQMALSGTVVKAGELGLRYGFQDIDGHQPAPWTMPPSWSQHIAQHYAALAAKWPRG